MQPNQDLVTINLSASLRHYPVGGRLMIASTPPATSNNNIDFIATLIWLLGNCNSHACMHQEFEPLYHRYL